MLELFKQHEYTGENRCLPCTVVNLAIAVALGGAVSGATVATAVATPTRAVAAGAAVVCASAVVVYLRGYLVPGTPTLTRRYLPASVLRWFGKEPAGPAQFDGGGSTVDPEAVLTDVGALEQCADRDDLCLTGEFRTAWNDRIEAVRGADIDGETVARRLGVPPEDCTIETPGDARILRRGSTFVGKWPSEAPLVADAAAAELLDARFDGWEDLSPASRGQLLNGLRLFVTDCPTGEGGVEIGEETVESCCSTTEVVAVTCEETGERVLEQPIQA
jgi:hypothetical protein